VIFEQAELDLTFRWQADEFQKFFGGDSAGAFSSLYRLPRIVVAKF
jgi:hypothetical protein